MHYGIGRRTGGDGLPGRGPFGTNEGDTWAATGSEVQAMLDEREDGLILCVVMQRQEDGSLEEAYYTTANPEMIAEAQAGTEKLWAAQAVNN